MFAIYNKSLFTKNLEVHNHDTGSTNNFHLPTTSLTVGPVALSV